MNESTVGTAISTTEHFKRQLENICRLVLLSPDERRKVDQAISEQVHQAHGISKMACLIKLENGSVLRLLVVFDEAVPAGRSLQKILSARVLR